MVAINWFHENKMIFNSGKLLVLVLDKCKSRNTEVKFIICSEKIRMVPSVDRQGITIDNKLNFDLHIDKICLKSANQVNPLAKTLFSE